MVAKEFTGHVRAMRAETDYFGAEDFVGDADIPLQIASVVYDDALKVGAGKAKPTFYLTMLNAAGKPCHKRMLLNASRRKMLSAMYGGITAEWKGKWVWVYVEPVKNPAGGDNVLGMKFRNRKDAPKPAGTKQPVTPDAPPPQVSDEHPTLEPLGQEGLDAVFTRYLQTLNSAATVKAAGEAYDAYFGPDSAHRWDGAQQHAGTAAYNERKELVRNK